MTVRFRLLTALAPLLVALLPLAALANPRPLPFTYTVETLPADGTELEQIVDMTPVRGLDASGKTPLMPRWGLTLEWEHGLTDRLELGLYTQFSAEPGLGSGAGTPFALDGLKQRLRYRISDADWPVEMAAYLEVAELATEIEVEAKLIVQRRLGRLKLVANLWAEREFYYSGQQEWVINPTAGASWELLPAWHVGLETWARQEFPETPVTGAVGQFNTALHAYAGPVVLANLGRLWWTTGVYGRLDAPDRPTQLGDQYGRVWVRTILGVGW